MIKYYTPFNTAKDGKKDVTGNGMDITFTEMDYEEARNYYTVPARSRYEAIIKVRKARNVLDVCVLIPPTDSARYFIAFPENYIPDDLKPSWKFTKHFTQHRLKFALYESSFEDVQGYYHIESSDPDMAIKYSKLTNGERR